jgi:hypothetical protein
MITSRKFARVARLLFTNCRAIFFLTGGDLWLACVWRWAEELLTARGDYEGAIGSTVCGH